MITPALVERIENGTITETETEQLRCKLRQMYLDGDSRIYGSGYNGYYIEVGGHIVGVGTHQDGSRKFKAFTHESRPVEVVELPPVSSRWIPFDGEPVADDAPETTLEHIGLAAR